MGIRLSSRAVQLRSVTAKLGRGTIRISIRFGRDGDRLVIRLPGSDTALESVPALLAHARNHEVKAMVVRSNGDRERIVLTGGQLAEVIRSLGISW